MAGDPHPDSPPEADLHPDSAPATRNEDARSDIEQAVEARSDAVERGEGGEEPDYLSSENGAGGEVKNQDLTAQ